MGTAILSQVTNESQYRQWPILFQEVVNGYHQKTALTASEGEAIFTMLCTIQLIAIAYFSHVSEWQDFANINRKNLVYLYPIRKEIESISIY
ncbi:hypothetical protein [uncultured Vagococcus sp.]|uniref:hypothetical protein n=1 Tax=uncultured Vagococcus sp. TaxID=189676 RepID=UPI0037DCE00A